jgi:hypothetical protein
LPAVLTLHNTLSWIGDILLKTLWIILGEKPCETKAAYRFPDYCAPPHETACKNNALQALKSGIKQSILMPGNHFPVSKTRKAYNG